MRLSITSALAAAMALSSAHAAAIPQGEDAPAAATHLAGDKRFLCIWLGSFWFGIGCDNDGDNGGNGNGGSGHNGGAASSAAAYSATSQAAAWSRSSSAAAYSASSSAAAYSSNAAAYSATSQAAAWSRSSSAAAYSSNAAAYSATSQAAAWSKSSSAAAYSASTSAAAAAAVAYSSSSSAAAYAQASSAAAYSRTSSAAAYSASSAAAAYSASSSAAAYSANAAAYSSNAAIYSSSSSAAAYSASALAAQSSLAAYSASAAAYASDVAAFSASISNAAYSEGVLAASASASASLAAYSASQSVAAYSASIASAASSASAYSASVSASAAAAQSTSVPSGWSHASTACIAEGITGRALTSDSMTSGEMTWAKCTSFCGSKGYPLAGIEYASECYCGYVLSNGASLDRSSDQCNMPTSGNARTIGGGPSVLSLFVSNSLNAAQYSPDLTAVEVALPGAWTATLSSGTCVYEGTTGRALAGASYAADDMTIGKCLAFCEGKGMQYAGIEYGRECYCGNDLVNGASLADTGACSMQCAGQPGTLCGAGNLLSVYRNANFEYTNTAVDGFAKQGCIQEVAGRALTGASTAGGDMTTAKCTAFCAAGGFAWAGIEYGSECYCGNELSNGASLAAYSTQCNMACSGAAGETCGGPNAITLYSTLSGNALVGA